MAFTEGSIFSSLSDLQFAVYADEHGVTPEASEIPSLACSLDRPVLMKAGVAVQTDKFAVHSEAVPSDALHFNTLGRPGQMDGWAVGESSAK